MLGGDSCQALEEIVVGLQRTTSDLCVESAMQMRPRR